MINVFRNPNFSNWFNVAFNGKLIDGARTHAQAIEIANRLSVKYSFPQVAKYQRLRANRPPEFSVTR
jgi:hypothetical protein